MDNKFDDKDIAIEQKYIQERLKLLDNYLIIPDRLRPENISIKSRRKKYYMKMVAAAACMVIILSSLISLYVITDKNNKLVPTTTLKKQEAERNTVSIEDIPDKVQDINELKNIYLSLINNGNFIDDSSCLKDETIMTPDLNEKTDEGDIVKTDNTGEHIYCLSTEYERSNENNFTFDKSKAKVDIVSTLKKGEMAKVNSIQIDGQALEMYLKDDRLVIITRPEGYYKDLLENKTITVNQFNVLLDELYKQNNGTSTDELNQKFTERYQYQNTTLIMVYDVSNVLNPKLVRKVVQDGYYSSSKLVDGDLYLVTNKYDYSRFYKNIGDIRDENILPFINDSASGEKGDKPIDLKSINIFSNPNSYEFTILSGINIKNYDKISTVACLGGSNAIYSSLNSMYFTSTDYLGRKDQNSTTNQDLKSTNIIKYVLKDGVPRMHSTEKIQGVIFNKFSISEYDGYLRIVTIDKPTINGVPSVKDIKSNVYVLNDDLKITGKIEGMLEGDQIKSVRIIDNNCYLVTDGDKNSLFALDFSDPLNLKLSNPLDLDGFSSYLYSYSNTDLIGIGKVTQQVVRPEDGSNVTLTEGVKLSFFDIGDSNIPKEIGGYVFGGRGTSSEVLYNHKAFLCSKEDKLLAFPVTLYENTNNDADPFAPGTVAFIGYYVFSIDENKGFTLKGRISHYDKLPDYTNSDDTSFFDNIGYEINRGINVDDVIYTISEKVVMANSLTDFRMMGKIELKN